jgi:hypothetical protein
MDAHRPIRFALRTNDKLQAHLLAGVVAVTLALSAAAAGAPVSASGKWNDCNFAPETKAAGPNLIVTVGITENFEGTLSGSYEGTERDVVYTDGGATFHGSGIFAGNVAGRSGTGRMSYEGTMPAGQQAKATWILVGMTGSLASVRAHGTFTGGFDGSSETCDAGLFSGSYEGSVNLGP